MRQIESSSEADRVSKRGALRRATFHTPAGHKGEWSSLGGVRTVLVSLGCVFTFDTGKTLLGLNRANFRSIFYRRGAIPGGAMRLPMQNTKPKLFRSLISGTCLPALMRICPLAASSGAS